MNDPRPETAPPAVQDAPPPWIMPEDLRNGVLDAALFTSSISLVFGFHPVVPVVNFIDGMLGRHLSRLRSTIMTSGEDTAVAKAAALLIHAAGDRPDGARDESGRSFDDASNIPHGTVVAGGDMAMPSKEYKAP